MFQILYQKAGLFDDIRVDGSTLLGDLFFKLKNLSHKCILLGAFMEFYIFPTDLSLFPNVSH